MLNFLQVRKHFNGLQIFEIPNLQLSKGIYWLQGVNGSGKTTLLRMIAGLIPFDGDISFDGISQIKMPLEYRKSVSLAESEPIYPSFVTGYELLQFYAHIRNESARELDYLVSYFGTKDYLSMQLGSYSSGMVKRLSLLLALIGRPSLILLDEPLATLDTEATRLLPDLIRLYNRDHGTSFIFTSHQPLETGSLMLNNKLLLKGNVLHLTP